MDASLQCVEGYDYLWKEKIMCSDWENYEYEILYIDSDTPLCFSESGHSGSRTIRNDILGQSPVTIIRKGESSLRSSLVH